MKYFLKFAVVTTIIFLTVFHVCAQAQAATFKEGDNITIPSGKVINDDLYIAGGTVTIEGTINGDLFIGGGSVTINGVVNGDLFAGGGSINLNGTVNDSMRIGGGNININGYIDDDLVAVGGNIILGSNNLIGRDLIGAGGLLQIDGSVKRDVKAAFGNVNILGTIGDDAKIETDKLTIASTAEIGGDLTYKSEDKADREAGSIIRGDIKRKIPREKDKAPDFISSLIGLFFARVLSSIWSFFALALVGIVLSFLAPHRLVLTGGKIKSDPWKSLGIGFLILFIVPIAIFFIFATIIGIPLAIIAVFGYAIALYATNVFVGYFVGKIIIDFWKVEKEIWPGFIMLLGLLILAFLRFIPILGFFISLAVMLFGLGAMFLAELDIRKKVKEAT